HKGERLSRSVRVGTVLDGQDVDAVAVIVDTVEDSVVSASGAIRALELELQRLARSERVLRDATVDEFNRRSGNLLGQPGKRAAGRGGPGDLKRTPGH